MLILSHFLTNCLIVSVCCTSFPNFSTRIFPPMIWKMAISMKAHSFIRQYIPYHIASTMGLGIIYLCIKLVCLSLHTTDIANQGHLSKKYIYKVRLHTTQNQRFKWGHVGNKHPKSHIYTDTVQTHIHHAQEMSRVCTWDRGPWHFIPFLEFWIILIRMRWKMLHGVSTAYQHDLNRILLCVQTSMHVQNTNCFSSIGEGVQPILFCIQRAIKWIKNKYLKNTDCLE